MRAMQKVPNEILEQEYLGNPSEKHLYLLHYKLGMDKCPCDVCSGFMNCSNKKVQCKAFKDWVDRGYCNLSDKKSQMHSIHHMHKIRKGYTYTS